MDLCECGCGIPLTARSPSEWFASQVCHTLWHASQTQPDPEVWRAKQRLFGVLFFVSFGWAQCPWTYCIDEGWLIAEHRGNLWKRTHNTWMEPPVTFEPTFQEILDFACDMWHQQWTPRLIEATLRHSPNLAPYAVPTRIILPAMVGAATPDGAQAVV